jgi:NADH-quinone oxidoreductase subunit J
MSGEFIAFLVLALIAIAGGVLMINLTQVVHMVIALVFTFVSIAGIFILLSAEFLAAVQILIYSGAITIIMLFGIMLTRHNNTSEPKSSIGKRLLILGGITAFAISVYFGIYNLEFTTQASDLHVDNTEQIGIALYTKYIIPFELTSVILLVALIGAIVLAKKDNKKEANDE